MILPARARDALDDAAALELADRFAGAEELAGQVDPDHRIPLRQRHRLERRVALQAGVVHQDVDGTEDSDTASNISRTSSSCETSARRATARLPPSRIVGQASSASASPAT